ncbi:MAG: VCBS repeat-containing protein, partial [Planctomycetota bacterium]|nr:VCBS repeat-containing protein [Planctomycetota bacterium]
MGFPRRRWITGALVLGATGAFAIYWSVRSDGVREPEVPARAIADAGTRAMAARLASIARGDSPEDNAFLNRRRAALYRDMLADEISPRDRFEISIRLGLELLRAGETTAAIETLKSAQEMSRRAPSPSKVDRWMLHQFLGVAYLRLGEQENCLARHGCDSCLLPIRGGGVHVAPRGSRGAIRHLTAALEIKPDDLTSRWLLNVAHMTLGEHPGKVARRWLIPAESFRSDREIPRFLDVAPEAGLDVVGLSGGAALEDFDGDGLLDVVCSSWGPGDQLRFFRSLGDGHFSDRTEKAGLRGIVGGLNLVHADYDNDGHPDVLLLRGAWLGRQGARPNSLLRNRGDGTFADVTEAAGLLTLRPTQTAAWGDYNGDGWLDVFIGNESEGEVRNPCELFHNLGDGTFVECAADVGLAHVGFVKGAVWGDYDGDGDPDLYLSSLGEKNSLYRNDGPGAELLARPAAAGRPAAAPVRPWTFTDVAEKAVVTEPLHSFPVCFWDYDNDGWEDLLVLSYGWEETAAFVAADYLGLENNGVRPRLYRNRGDGTFDDVTRRARLDRVLIAMGSGFGDIDGDGYLDAYVGTGEPSLSALMPNRMFRNDRGQVFQDVTTSGGFGHLQKGHAVAFGDVDGDGDEDIYTVLGGAYEGDVYPNALLENPG